MVTRLKVRQPDGSYFDFSPRAPAFDDNDPLIKMGMSWADGAAAEGQALLMDTEGDAFNGYASLPGHGLCLMTEDATGPELWLAGMRRKEINQGRGKRVAAANAEWDLLMEDVNRDLDIHLLEAVVRPEETDTDRLYWLQGYILNGASSTATKPTPTSGYPRASTDITVLDSHRCPDTNTVTMPAKTYPKGTTPREIIEDCASTAGKTWGVTIHHASDVTGGDASWTFDGTYQNDEGTGYYWPSGPGGCELRATDTSGTMVNCLGVKGSSAGHDHDAGDGWRHRHRRGRRDLRLRRWRRHRLVTSSS